MKKILLVLLFLAIWVSVHIPGIFYGTQNIPLHISYIGDEQAPINGALHIVADKNLLALRNLKTVYYGPVFSVIAIPPVIADFAGKYISGKIYSAEEYKNALIWDWGGIAWKARLLSVLVAFLALIALFKLLNTSTFNPTRNTYFPYIGALILGTHFYFFEYSHFFRHWIFVVSILIAQIYCLVRIHETDKKKYWFYQMGLTVAMFGISYLGLFFQIMWIPSLVRWLKQGFFSEKMRWFVHYLFVVTIFVALIMAWHPHAFNRILGLTSGDAAGVDTSAFSAESTETTGTAHSYMYYGRMLVNNDFALLLLVIILVMYLSIKKKVYVEYWFQSLAILILGYFFIFGWLSHHESRYILPIAILLIILVFSLIGKYWKEIQEKKVLYTVCAALLIITFLYHGLADIRRVILMQKGPIEQQEIVDLVKWQKENPKGKILALQYYLFGHPHTKAAYQDYMERFNKKDFTLYKTILETPLPTDTTALNVYYVRPDSKYDEKKLFAEYDRVVRKFEPEIENHLEPDFYEVNLLRLGQPDAFLDKYEVLK